MSYICHAICLLWHFQTAEKGGKPPLKAPGNQLTARAPEKRLARWRSSKPNMACELFLEPCKVPMPIVICSAMHSRRLPPAGWAVWDPV